jgi:hypothetical protein
MEFSGNGILSANLSEVIDLTNVIGFRAPRNGTLRNLRFAVINATDDISLALGESLSYGATVYISNPVVDNPTGLTTAPIPVATTLSVNVVLTAISPFLNFSVGDIIANSNTTDSVAVNAGDLIVVVFDQTILSPFKLFNTTYNVFVGFEFA